MKIRVIAENDQAKGKSFEILIGMILENLGYTNLKTNIRAAGMELDIEANHKSKKLKILCECKAHEKSIEPDDLKIFHGKLRYEIDKKNVNKGFFFSLSGFTSNADRWYNDASEDTRKVLPLYGTKDIILLLHSSNLLATEERIDEIVRRNSSYDLAEKYLIFYQSDLYLIQLLSLKDEITSYMILRGLGGVVSSPVMDAIAKLDKQIQNYRRIDPVITKKVSLNLLDLGEKCSEQISAEIQETVDDIQVAIGDLKLQKIIIANTDGEEPKAQFKINSDLQTLKILTSRFVTTDDKFVFMSTPYINSAVNEKFLDFVIDRFKIPADEKIKKIMIQSARMFPSVLYFFLLGENETYCNFHNSLQRFKSREDVQSLNNIMLSQFFKEIYENILADLRTAESTYLSNKEILGYHHKFEIKFGSQLELLLQVSGSAHTYIATKEIGDEIKQGEIISPVNVGANIRLGNHLLSINEYNLAIETFDVVIKNSKDPELLSAAWNNKAQCFRMMGKHPEELSCINNALKYKTTRNILSNKILCLESMKRISELEKTKKQLAKLFPN